MKGERPVGSHAIREVRFNNVVYLLFSGLKTTESPEDTEKNGKPLRSLCALWLITSTNIPFPEEIKKSPSYLVITNLPLYISIEHL